jgi:hypothetical protein
MPASSEKQKRFMDAAAHNPAFAKAAGVPQNVAKDFSEKSKGMKFGSGSSSRPDLQKANKPEARHGKEALFSKGGKTMAKSDSKEDMKMDKKQDVALIKKAFKEHDAQEHKGGKGTSLKLKKGGTPMKETIGPRTMAKDVEKGSNKLTKFGQSAVQKRGTTKGEEPTMPKFARGGGVESKGKTKGKNIAMCGGGMAKGRK